MTGGTGALLHDARFRVRMDVRRLVRYHLALTDRYADYFDGSCSWSELSENHETSHNTIANVSMHMANMEDWWLHYVVPGKEWDGPAWDGAKRVADVTGRMREVAARTRALLDGLADEEMRRKRTLPVGEDKREVTLEDVLVEVLAEVTTHRGEVNAMLWRRDKEPPYVGFLEWAGA